MRLLLCGWLPVKPKPPLVASPRQMYVRYDACAPHPRRTRMALPVPVSARRAGHRRSHHSPAIRHCYCSPSAYTWICICSRERSQYGCSPMASSSAVQAAGATRGGWGVSSRWYTWSRRRRRVLDDDNSGRNRSLAVGGWLIAAYVQTAGGSSLYVGEALAGVVQMAGGVDSLGMAPAACGSSST
ncbi:hypothetical protein U9M48_001447 [Paspalum notatum var. saurae]|uniref:Uncharacterized protein n=1 Tax=Paspalum notatum var. saurae TaxID=547442 RepID=A0AAQ3PNM4_PASNO